jgi:hypothetical protein
MRELTKSVNCKNVFQVCYINFLQNEYQDFYIYIFTFLQNKDKYIIYR